MFAIEAWTDQYATWRKEFLLKREAGQDVALEAREGHELLTELMPHEREARARGRGGGAQVRRQSAIPAVLLDESLAAAMEKTRRRAPTSPAAMSCRWSPTASAPAPAPGTRWCRAARARVPGKHGTFDDCIARAAGDRRARLRRALSHADPSDRPHQPQGQEQRAQRRARTIPAASTRSATSTAATTPSHPELGTLDDFRRLVEACARARHGDRARLRGAVLARPSLAEAASGMVHAPARRLDQVRREPAEEIRGHRQSRFQLRRPHRAVGGAARRASCSGSSQGVRIFRVDNPHTKPLPFWEWLIREVQDARIRTSIFLAEAFTRPKVMKALAKLGFSQSYTYFTWRTTKAELQEYLSELTGYPERDYFRPNFFVNTPDITAGAAADRRGLDVQVARRARRHAVVELRHLQRLRADRARADPRPRGISQFREIRDQDARLEQAGQHQGLSAAGSIRIRRAESGAAADRQPALPARSTTTTSSASSRNRSTRDNAVAVAISLTGSAARVLAAFRRSARSARRTTRRPVRVIENLVTGERHLLEWGGVAPAHRSGRRSGAAFPLLRLRRAMNVAPDIDAESEGRATTACGTRTPIIYQLHVKAFIDSNGDGIGDFAGLTEQARLSARSRRHHAVAAAVLSEPRPRRRLRHRRLRRHQSRLRHHAGFPPLHARGQAARPARDHRAGHQPHLRPASLVQARQAQRHGHRARATGTSGATPTRNTSGTRIIFTDTEKSNWTWDPGGAGLLLAPLLLAPAGPELRQSARGAARCCR